MNLIKPIYAGKCKKKSLKIRMRKSKKNRQHNGQKKKDRMTNNDLQNTTHKTQDRVTRIPLKVSTPVLRKR